MYDEAEISAWFRGQAERADSEFSAQRGQDGADAILARSCVFSYLYDRYFLETKDLLLNELRWLKRVGKPRAPDHAASVTDFEESRDRLLDQLIDRFAGDEG